MATLPVTPKKEGKENYFAKQRLLAKETFAVFISAIQYPRYIVLWKDFMGMFIKKGKLCDI